MSDKESEMYDRIQPEGKGCLVWGIVFVVVIVLVLVIIFV